MSGDTLTIVTVMWTAVAIMVMRRWRMMMMVLQLIYIDVAVGRCVAQMV